MSEHAAGVDVQSFTAEDYEQLGRALVAHAQQKVQTGAVKPADGGNGLQEFEVGPLTVRLRVQQQDHGMPSPDARPSGGGCCVCVVEAGGVIVCRGWCCPGQPLGG